MPTKRFKPEQIVNLLRRIEVEIANGKKAVQPAREVGICEQTFYCSYCISLLLPKESMRLVWKGT